MVPALFKISLENEEFARRFSVDLPESVSLKGGINFEVAHGILMKFLINLLPEHKTLVHPKNSVGAISLKRFSKNGRNFIIGVLDDRISEKIEAAGKEFPEAIVLLEKKSWEGLGTYKSFKKVKLNFVSPIVFISEKVFKPFPLPEFIVDSLNKKWKAFSSLEMKNEARGDHLMLNAFNLKTVQEKGKSFFVIGAVGWASYIVTERREEIGKLMDLARFSGIGAKTSFGMGSVNVEFI